MKLGLVLLVALPVLAACRPRAEPAPVAAAASDGGVVPIIELRNPTGQLTLAMTPRGDGEWDVAAEGHVYRARRASADCDGGLACLPTVTVVDQAGGLLARLSPGPAGWLLVDAGGKTALRVNAPGNGAVYVLSPDGVAIVRIRPVEGGADGHDAAGVLSSTAVRQTDRIDVHSRDGALVGAVRGTDDPTVAIILALDTLPPVQRAAISTLLLH